MSRKTSGFAGHGHGRLLDRLREAELYGPLDAAGRAGKHEAASELLAATVASYTADTFGNGVASSGSAANRFKWNGESGYYSDAESGLKVGGRDYDPGVSSWISQDGFVIVGSPADSQSLDRYTYCRYIARTGAAIELGVDYLLVGDAMRAPMRRRSAPAGLVRKESKWTIHQVARERLLPARCKYQAPQSAKTKCARPPL